MSNSHLSLGPFVYLIYLDRDDRGRNDRYSSRQSRSISKSVSPRNDERDYMTYQRSTRRSRSISAEPYPHEERNLKSTERANQGENGRYFDHEDYAQGQSRSQIPRGNSRSLSRSRSRSYRYILCLVFTL